MTRSSISTALALAGLLAMIWPFAALSGPATLEPISDRNLSQVRGADLGAQAVIGADCDQRFASGPGAQYGDVPCGDCTDAQVKASKLCDCCDGGGEVNITINQIPGGNVPGVKANAPVIASCGNLNYRNCAYVNGKATCNSNLTPTQTSCGNVTQYFNQAAIGQ